MVIYGMPEATLYDPAHWRSTEQIRNHLSANHPYRIGASTSGADGRDRVILVNDTRRTVHHLDITPVRPRHGKAWTLELLRQLDSGAHPDQTYDSRHAPEATYRRYAR